MTGAAMSVFEGVGANLSACRRSVACQSLRGPRRWFLGAGGARLHSGCGVFLGLHLRPLLGRDKRCDWSGSSVLYSDGLGPELLGIQTF